jgi:hypothetical protein
MATITTAAAIVAALLILPALILWRLSLTPQQNARRLHRRGHSYRAIGARLGVAHSTARRYCLA